MDDGELPPLLPVGEHRPQVLPPVQLFVQLEPAEDHPEPFEEPLLEEPVRLEEPQPEELQLAPQVLVHVVAEVVRLPPHGPPAVVEPVDELPDVLEVVGELPPGERPEVVLHHQQRQEVVLGPLLLDDEELRDVVPVARGGGPLRQRVVVRHPVQDDEDEEYLVHVPVPSDDLHEVVKRRRAVVAGVEALDLPDDLRP